MQQGFETEQLNEKQVMELAGKYPQLEVIVQVWGDIIVKSKKDTWVVRDEGRFLTLYHRATVLERGRIKEKYHVQDVFYDLEFILASIISHDDYALGIQKRDIEGIKELIAQSN